MTFFSGASMSGDLKHPSKAIPKGTLYGLLLTFISYTIVILSMATTVTRASFYRNTNVIQLVCDHPFPPHYSTNLVRSMYLGLSYSLENLQHLCSPF